MVRELPPGYLPRPHWPVDRFPPDPIESYRYHHHEQQDFRGPPMGIDRALREQCKIPAKYYFVAAVLDDGTEVTFSSPNRSQEGLVPKFFNMQRWVQWTTHGSNATSPLVEEPDLGTEEYSRPAHSEYSNRRAYDRRRVHSSDAFDAQRNRKRPRAVGFHRELDLVDDDPAPIVKAKKVSIKIGDSKQVWDLYDQRFRNLQQTACKIMAKAWVKLVEPKKQSTHPYTGSDEKAPDWWPKPWGPTRDEKVRHKEPDHLYKKGTIGANWATERVYLLNHILGMIVQPNAKQHLDIQKLNLNVEKLQAATDEALSAFFLDKDNPNNGKKKPYLKELFHVARFEERYRNGEIDGDTDVWVMADDKTPESYQSDNEDSTPSREEEETEPVSIAVPSTVSPQRTNGTALMPAPAPAPTPNEHDQNNNMQNASFLTDLPHRGHPYQTPMLSTNLNTDHHPYMEGGAMGVNGPGSMHAPPVSMALQEICPNPHDSSRRGSLFNTSADFGTPTTPAIYQTWQQSTTAPTNSPMYSFTPQQQTPNTGPFVPQATVPSYMGPPFDSLPRAGFDPSQESLFRGTTVSSAPVHTQGYPMPLPHDHRGLQGQKTEAHGRGLH